MKSFVALASVLVLLNINESQAVTLQAQFTDEISQALAESEAKEEAEENRKHPAAAAPAKPAEAKKQVNKTKTAEVEIPMDQSAIDAYSSVIADAAEDSVPEKPVTYTETDVEKTNEERAARPPSQV